MKKAQNKAKHGDAIIMETPAPEGAATWEEWEQKIIREKEEKEKRNE